MNKKIIILGRTASGKSTVVGKVAAIIRTKGVFAWTMQEWTTRPPREGETINGDEGYHFHTDERFDAEEFASSINPGGWVKYGIPLKPNQRDGVGFFSPISLSYAVDTANGFKGEDVMFVVLDIPRDARMQRLIDRGELPDIIAKRFEVENVEGEYDLSLLPSKPLVLNDANATPDELAENIVANLFPEFFCNKILSTLNNDAGGTSCLCRAGTPS